MADNTGQQKTQQIGISDIEWKEAPYILGSGVCMGTADVVPGVSGGTMAIAVGIYTKLLAGIASVNSHSVRALLTLKLRRAFEILHWRFLGSLLAGIFLGVVVMLKVVRLPLLLETQPTLVYAVFFGLVFASALVLTRRIPAWNALRVALVLVGAAVGYSVVNLVPVDTPDSPAFVFLCGVFAICAMLLPGISGSFILLILGKYEYVIGALDGLLRGDLSQLRVIVPFGLGCLLGIAAFSRFLGWLLHKWHDPVLAFLIGLLFGSLWRIWPYQHLTRIEVRGKMRVVGAEPFWPDPFDASVVALILVGLGIVLAIEYVASRRTVPARA
jgi:putative membrane protein